MRQEKSSKREIAFFLEILAIFSSRFIPVLFFDFLYGLVPLLFVCFYKLGRSFCDKPIEQSHSVFSNITFFCFSINLAVYIDVTCLQFFTVIGTTQVAKLLLLF